MTTRFFSATSRSRTGVNSSGSAMLFSSLGTATPPPCATTPTGARPISGCDRSPPLGRGNSRSLRGGLQAGDGDGDGVAFGGVGGRHLAGSLQHRVGDRAYVRVNALEVAQHVEVQRRRLQRLGPARAQPLEVTLGRGE